MKRGLVFTLCAAVVAAAASPALAVVDVQLNLRYTDPNNATGGGTWDLLAKTSATQGIAGLTVNINGNLGVTGTDTPALAVTPNNAVFNNTTSVFRYGLFGGMTQVVAGDDLVAANLVVNVGRPGGPGIVAQDDLYTPSSVFWDNSSLLASGTWTGARPTMAAANIGANEFNGSGVAVLATLGTVSVRGDSTGVDGMKPGDANRDGVVNSLDFSILSANWLSTTSTWNQGNFNSVTGTNSLDFSILSANWLASSAPPAAGAVPEPTGAALLGIALLGLAVRSKRR